MPQIRKLSTVEILEPSTSAAIDWSAFEYYPPLQRVRAHFIANPSQALTLLQAASIAAMAPTSFSRFFRCKTGITFKYWMDYIRVNRAYMLLCSSDITVLHASTMCGFSDVTTFARTFRRIHGSTPIEFKRQYRATVRRRMLRNAE